MNRRRFFTYATLLGGTAVVQGNTIYPLLNKYHRTPDNLKLGEIQAEVVIIGGGLGGCAAALAACRNGLRVILTEETDWIGGQLS